MDMLAHLKEAQNELNRRRAVDTDPDLDKAQALLDAVVANCPPAGQPLSSDQEASLAEAEDILNVWLVDNTEDVFEEEPEVDSARSDMDTVLNHQRKLTA